MPSDKKVFVVMGVSSTGKTTVGRLLAQKLNVPFFDGDDFHTKANVEKMRAGMPLDDMDREGWLKALNLLAKDHKSSGAVIACSALKQSYRDLLRDGMDPHLDFIFLEGTLEFIKNRMEQRKGHFMPIELLQSQFDTLEVPKNAITVSVDQTPEKLVVKILKNLQ